MTSQSPALPPVAAGAVAEEGVDEPGLDGPHPARSSSAPTPANPMSLSILLRSRSVSRSKARPWSKMFSLGWARARPS
jgi:hypothetical protein